MWNNPTGRMRYNLNFISSSHSKTSQAGKLLKNNPCFSWLSPIFLYIIPCTMHQEQHQKSQGFVMQFHWKIAQEFSNKCLWESLYFCGSQSFISGCSSCPLDQFTPKLFVIKQDLQISFISTNIAHDLPNHHSTTAQRPAKITAFKDQRMVSNIFYSHWKEWENTVTGIQQTRIYQKLHRILNKEL